MARGIVSRLSVAAEVQRLCSLAVKKADKLMASKSTATINFIEGSFPAACKFLFEEVTCSSVVLLLIELSTASINDIKGYKLWYCKTREEVYSKEPTFVFPRDQRRIWISNLQSCTECSFRIIAYTEAGDVGHSEVKCFTKSVELIHKNLDSTRERPEVGVSHGGSSSDKQSHKTEEIELDSGFKVQDLGRILNLAWLQHQGCLELFCSSHVNKCFNDHDVVKPETQQERMPSVSRQLNLNVATVPDMNEEFIPPVESSREEENGCTLGQAVEADDAISHGIHRKYGEVPAGSKLVGCQKGRHSGIRDTHDSDSTLTNGSSFQVQNDLCLDENFEYCVKIIRWLEHRVILRRVLD